MQKRKLGIFVSLAVAPAVYYLGVKLLSHDPSPPATPSKPAEARPADGSAKQHERKMLLAALKEKPDHVPLLFRLAQLAQEAGDRDQAVKYLREVLKAEPNNSDALLELGKALYESGDVAGALANTKRILQREPNHSAALLNLGAVYANMGDAKSARQYWTRLVNARPESEDAGRAVAMLKQLPAGSP